VTRFGPKIHDQLLYLCEGEILHKGYNIV